MGKEIKKAWRLAVDFDGVLHSYSSGWQGVDVIPDPPVAGARDFLKEAGKYFDEVVILTSRARDVRGKEAINTWMKKHGLPLLPIFYEKIPADVYLDDRGFRFEGKFPDVEMLSGLDSWRHSEESKD